ncbi:type I-F CRISPR-associated protein Csy2 [Pseudovibrio flavus]|uniref:type I-F CRISPR-associated protein Csy2 n=1 Tax=Pseudovibrio flavus TaxID=2529854 RepID=UPI00211CDE3B|nr:type I-F CRISPR-associated protein Csy2 [Pseudovibrio flavus]
MIFSISGIVADRVNLLMNDYASGLPSPLAFLGLGAAIAPSIGCERWAVRVLPILHNVTASHGRTKPEAEPKSGSFQPIELIEDTTGHVVFSLFIDAPGCERADKVTAALQRARLAGGLFQNADRLQAEAVANPSDTVRHLRRGYGLVHARPERALVSTGDNASIEAIARTLHPEERGPDHGCPVAVAVGHRLLEDPATAPKRRNTRSAEIPHVFSEPVVGIGELVSVREATLREASPESFLDLFWSWTTQGEWVFGHPTYLKSCNATSAMELENV